MEWVEGLFREEHDGRAPGRKIKCMLTFSPLTSCKLSLKYKYFTDFVWQNLWNMLAQLWWSYYLLYTTACRDNSLFSLSTLYLGLHLLIIFTIYWCAGQIIFCIKCTLKYQMTFISQHYAWSDTETLFWCHFDLMLLSLALNSYLCGLEQTGGIKEYTLHSSCSWLCFRLKIFLVTCGCLETLPSSARDCNPPSWP